MATAGRALPPPSPFAGDDGSADPALAGALERYRQGTCGVDDVVTALAQARVLLPVLAELEVCAVTDDGLRVDKEASSGIVALRAPDGRTALPVFSSVDTMRVWAADVRPMPARASLAAASALQEGWEVMVVDPGGASAVIPRPAVRALALGETWQPAVVGGAVRADVRAALVQTVTRLDGVVAGDAVPGRSAEVAAVLSVRPGLDRSGLDAVLARAGAALATDGLVTAAVDSLELRVVSAP